MTDLALTLTCTDYARVMPLATREVRPEGIDLTLQLGKRGSWPMRAELLRRAVSDPAVHGGEGSMGAHVRRIDKGDRSFVGLPIFVLRNFTARDLYVRHGGAVATAADLVGKRLGMYDWYASGSIWYRHLLGHFGVGLDQVSWVIGNIEPDGALKKPAAPPSGVAAALAPEGKFLGDMLANGEIDALFSPPRPTLYHPKEGPIVRLFADIRSVERGYFQQTGVFPPQHLMVLRREVWERAPWIARSLTTAFVQCNDWFDTTQRSFPYASPWLEAELDETISLMGQNFHPYGMDENRRTMELFCEQAFKAGLTERLVSVDDYFAEYLSS